MPRTLRRFATLVVALVLAVPATSPASLATEETGTVRGSLVDSNGQPLAGYRIKLVDASGNARESAPTGADGKYEIAGLPPGTYEYQIVDPEGLLITVRIPPVVLEAGTILTQPIAIVPSKKSKGKLIAWVAGGAGAVALAVAAANDSGGNGNDGDNETPMTASAPRDTPQ